MSGNPRWIYCHDGANRELHDFTPLLLSLKAVTATEVESREQPSSALVSRSRARGSGSSSGVGVRVPAAKLEALRSRFGY
jgi:hypothetical protein